MVFIFHIQHMNIKTINLSNEEKNCTWGQLLKMFFSVLMHSKNLIFLSKKWITKSNYKKFIFFLLDSCQYFNLFQSLLYNSRCQIFLGLEWNYVSWYKTSFLTYIRPMGTWQLLQPMKNAHVSLCIRKNSWSLCHGKCIFHQISDSKPLTQHILNIQKWYDFETTCISNLDIIENFHYYYSSEEFLTTWLYIYVVDNYRIRDIFFDFITFELDR